MDRRSPVANNQSVTFAPDPGADLVLQVHVRPFGGSPLLPSYRAVVQIGDRAFVGALRPTKLDAVKVLFAQLAGGASWSDDADLRLDIELNGGASFLDTFKSPRAEIAAPADTEAE